MKKFYQALAIILCTCLPLLSHASSLSSTITLTGGTIGPKQDIEISFNPLLESVIYEVRCLNITSNAKSNLDIDYLALYSSNHNLQPTINGKVLHDTWQGEILTRSVNDLSLKNVTSATGSIIIRNLDDTDTVHVDTCFAYPQV